MWAMGGAVAADLSAGKEEGVRSQRCQSGLWTPQVELGQMWKAHVRASEVPSKDANCRVWPTGVDHLPLRVCRRAERTKEGDSNIVKNTETNKGRRTKESDQKEQAESQGRAGSGVPLVAFLRAILIKCGPAAGFRDEWRLRKGTAFVCVIPPRREGVVGKGLANEDDVLSGSHGRGGGGGDTEVNRQVL